MKIVTSDHNIIREIVEVTLRFHLLYWMICVFFDASVVVIVVVVMVAMDVFAVAPDGESRWGVFIVTLDDPIVGFALKYAASPPVIKFSQKWRVYTGCFAM